VCELTKKEEQILEKLRVCEVSIAAQELGIKPSTIYVVRSRVRAKAEQAQDFLKKVKKYRDVLYGSGRYHVV